MINEANKHTKTYMVNLSNITVMCGPQSASKLRINVLTECHVNFINIVLTDLNNKILLFTVIKGGIFLFMYPYSLVT